MKKRYLIPLITATPVLVLSAIVAISIYFSQIAAFFGIAPAQNILLLVLIIVDGLVGLAGVSAAFLSIKERSEILNVQSNARASKLTFVFTTLGFSRDLRS